MKIIETLMTLTKGNDNITRALKIGFSEMIIVVAISVIMYAITGNLLNAVQVPLAIFMILNTFFTFLALKSDKAHREDKEHIANSITNSMCLVSVSTMTLLVITNIIMA